MTSNPSADVVDFDDVMVAAFWSRVTRKGPDECWLWTGPSTSGGRGTFSFSGKRFVASRFALILRAGHPADDSLFACHSCDNPACCNPSHLWWGSNADNILDASTKGRLWQNKVTHCPKGHPYSPENMRIVKGNQRRCQACAVAANRVRRAEARRLRNGQ